MGLQIKGETEEHETSGFRADGAGALFMKRETIVGKVIHLAKEIKFSEPAVTAVMTQFLTGGTFGVGGFGLQWWYTPLAVDTAEDIARMLIQHEPALTNGDADSFKKLIFKSLEQGVFACGLFDGDKVCFRK